MVGRESSQDVDSGFGGMGVLCNGGSDGFGDEAVRAEWWLVNAGTSRNRSGTDLWMDQAEAVGVHDNEYEHEWSGGSRAQGLRLLCGCAGCRGQGWYRTCDSEINSLPFLHWWQA